MNSVLTCSKREKRFAIVCFIIAGVNFYLAVAFLSWYFILAACCFLWLGLYKLCRPGYDLTPKELERIRKDIGSARADELKKALGKYELASGYRAMADENRRLAVVGTMREIEMDLETRR